MTRYLARRLLLTIPVLLGVATLVFALIHLVPGDPAQTMLGESASPDEVARLRTTLGLDKPLLAQYGDFLAGVARGDLGTSFRYGTPVASEIRQRVPDTAVLAVCAMAVALVFAIPLGIIAATFRGRFADHVAMTIALAGISMPNFWLGPLLAILFAVNLGWLPVAGSGTAAHLVLSDAGVGRLLIQAINNRDYPLVQGCILFISVTYVAMNLITDLTYGFLDPRIRFD